MKALSVALLAFFTVNVLAAVNCTISQNGKTETFKNAELGPMLSRFTLKQLVQGKLIDKKIGLNLMSDSTEDQPATKLTVSFSDMSEPVMTATGFARGKRLNSLSFDLATAQTVHMEMGDQEAGETVATVSCEVK